MEDSERIIIKIFLGQNVVFLISDPRRFMKTSSIECGENGEIDVQKHESSM